jgi:hypothetical protein
MSFFELTICAFDTHSGWRDAFERKREYTRRYIFMENLILKTHSKTAGNEQVLIFYPNGKSTGKEKNPNMNAYGKTLPDKEIRSFMG